MTIPSFWNARGYQLSVNSSGQKGTARGHLASGGWGLASGVHVTASGMADQAIAIRLVIVLGTLLFAEYLLFAWKP